MAFRGVEGDMEKNICRIEYRDIFEGQKGDCNDIMCSRVVIPCSIAIEKEAY